MYLERITENNIGFAVSIQEVLFPGESARANFEESLVDSSGYEYFLIYVGDDCAGVIGLYCIPDDSACIQYKTLIFSKTLTDGPMILWNGRNMHLTEQIEKQRKYHKVHQGQRL